MFLLDTNVISEIRKGKRCDPNVNAWIAAVSGDDLYLSVLVTGEIRRGVERARTADLVRANALESWLRGLDIAFEGRILPVTQEIADVWGRMNAIRTLPVIDGLLAATASVHKMALVTRNSTDVENLGLQVLNPFRTTSN